MKPRYRWYVAFVCFLFLLFHQADKYLISPLVTPIMEEFQINEAQMGAVSSLAIIVSALLYPLWGYLFDRYARPKLLALASLIWGSTTWLSALAPTFPAFVATRASTGIDDSSYPGLFSLMSDYFEPGKRGRVYGVLRMSGPLGFMLGTVLAATLGGSLGWRNVFFITGSVGVIVAVLIFFTVRERPRGVCEPEMQEVGYVDERKIEWATVRSLFRNRSFLLLMVQGFFGVFPWNVLTFWFFRYLETERGYSSGQAMTTMIVAIVTLSAGYYVGGYLGDLLFQRMKQGRIIVSALGVLAGAAFLYVTMSIPAEQTGLFMVLLGLTGVTMSMASPNVTALTFDVTVPEVRSTAQSIQKLVEDGGSAVSPFLAGLIATRYSLHVAILVICIATWLLCAAFFATMIRTVPHDVDVLRQTMRERAAEAGGQA
jgi:predicted MFS family arabinose efflux permease